MTSNEAGSVKPMEERMQSLQRNLFSWASKMGAIILTSSMTAHQKMIKPRPIRAAHGPLKEERRGGP